MNVVTFSFSFSYSLLLTPLRRFWMCLCLTSSLLSKPSSWRSFWTRLHYSNGAKLTMLPRNSRIISSLLEFVFNLTLRPQW